MRIDSASLVDSHFISFRNYRKDKLYIIYVRLYFFCNLACYTRLAHLYFSYRFFLIHLLFLKYNKLLIFKNLPLCAHSANSKATISTTYQQQQQHNFLFVFNVSTNDVVRRLLEHQDDLKSVSCEYVYMHVCACVCVNVLEIH